MNGELIGQVNNLGLPYIEHFEKQDYQGGTQNWDFTQDDNGNLFVANNDGMLTYDGTQWKTYPLPNKTIARSLAFDSLRQRVYIGGQDAFGYFSSDEKTGILEYHDCKQELAPDQQEFTDVWSIIFGPEEQVFFRSSGRVFELQKSTSRVHSFNTPVTFLGEANGQIIVQEYESKISHYQQGEFVPLPNAYILQDKTIVAICPGAISDEIWIATANAGLYLMKEGVITPYPILQQSWLTQQHIQAANMTNEGLLVLASSSQGAILVDLEQKRLQLHLNKGNGLQQNHVRSVFIDQNNDLWLGFDNGIGFVDLESPFSRFIPDIDLESTTYSVRIYNNHLYVGNSNGLYIAPWQSYYNPVLEKSIFELITGSAGQVWSLEEVANHLWLGHDVGAFMVEERNLIPFSEDIGYWKFLTIKDHRGQEQLLAGNYFGLRLLDEKSSRPQFKPISAWEQSARIIVSDQQQQVWVSHPYRGIYRFDFTKPTDELNPNFYGEQNGLPSDLENYVFNIFDELIVCAEQGVYQYDMLADSFQIHPYYTPFFPPDDQLRRLEIDAFGNLWYISKTEAGRLIIQQQGLEQSIIQERYPEIRSQLVSGFEYVYPYDEHHVFFGAEKGVILFNPHKSTNTALAPSTQLTKVQLSNEKGDELQWTGQFIKQQQDAFTFSSHEHNFKFAFTTPVFGELSQAEYQFHLEGLEDNFGIWTANTNKEYTNLSPGDYTFHCRARVNQGSPGVNSSFSFTISPPWYASALAFIFYGIITLLGLWSLIQVPRKQFAREKAAMVQQQERQVFAFEQEVQASEQTIDQLKSEKYRSELAFQSKELASLTMYIVQKNELISRIGNELEVVKGKLKDKDLGKLVRPLEQLLTEDEIIENDWDQFVYHFDQVHSGFFQRLRQEYPQLTPKDHKLCAYLRMNLSTKDIAPLLNISIRGVEISRYRLRRKMHLPKEANLVEFMMNF